MTERDDFLREHLSPPAGSDDDTPGRPPARQDDAAGRTPADDAPSAPDNAARHATDDAVRRPPEEPVRPPSPDDRARRDTWSADRTNTGPQRIPPAGFRQGPPPARPAERESGAAGRAEGRPREATAADSTRVLPPAGARPSPGWQQEPPRERSSRPAGQEWSSQPSSAPNWAVAPAAAPPATGYSYVDSIRTSELVPTKKVPPRKGWRRVIYNGTFGLINLGPSPDELRQAELEAKIRSLLRGHYKIGVMGKGGVGKTTVAASVGSIFAELRQDDRVVAIDADTAFGKLGSRVDPKAAGSYWELAADQHLDTFADVRSRVGNNSAGLFVLAGEASPARRRVLDPAIYREATGAAGPPLHHLDRRLRLDDGLPGHPGGAARPRRADRGVLAVGRRRLGGRPDDGLAGQPRLHRVCCTAPSWCSTTPTATPTSAPARSWCSSSPAAARSSSRCRSTRTCGPAASST